MVGAPGPQLAEFAGKYLVAVPPKVRSPQRPSDSRSTRNARPNSASAGPATNSDLDDDGYVYEDDFDDGGDVEDALSKRIAEECPEELAAEVAAE